MSDDSEFSVEGARAAARRDRLGEWVCEFLASPGSDNAALGQKLTQELRWWSGPTELPLDQLHRLAGPPGEPVLCPIDEEDWDDRVAEMGQRAKQGWDPPPVIVASRDGQFVLEDGNHRVESVRQAGRTNTWAVVGFEEEGDRDRFAAGGNNSLP